MSHAVFPHCYYYYYVENKELHVCLYAIIIM